MSRFWTFIFVLVPLSLAATSATAQNVVATSGNIVVVAAPPSVVPGALISNTIPAFQERQNVRLGRNVFVNITTPGTYANFNATSTGTIPAGTLVNSFFLHSNTAVDTVLSGSITFDREILGVITGDDPLSATDGILGSPTTKYPTFVAARGYENDGDSVTLSEDKRTLTVTVDVSFPGDQLRVITAASPSPWQTLTNHPPFNASTALLLTDGTVMCQASNGNAWWQLTPDAFGSYVNGTWAQLASMHNPRLYYASAVLADGRVVVAGGEYNGTNVPVELDAAEIYDPLTNSWIDLPTPGWGHIGDAPCAVLDNGSLLLGDNEFNRTAILDPLSLTWSAAGNKLDLTSSEETWTLLPGGDVLTADCIAHPNSELFDPLGEFWFNAGPTTGQGGGDLVEAASIEIGPALLLPEGNVFAMGATGHNDYYNPRNGSWQAAPDFPKTVTGQQLGIKDGPSCLLPGGNVFCIAAPVDGVGNDYLGPTSCFEFDGAFIKIPSPPSAFLGFPAFIWRMLLLPTGQAFVTNGTGEAFVYVNTGVPADRWRPVITNFPAVVAQGATYTLSGNQFNGLSQANSYGDDAASATNYPLVRITNNQTGHVRYARTAHHSTMAVATGGAIVTTQFTVPGNIETGQSQLVVVANGIPSLPVNVNVTPGG